MTEEINDPWDTLAASATRTPRSLETRAKTEPKREWREPSLLPDPEPQDGYVFKWIRSTSRGTDDKLNVDKRFREGWEPVRAESHPEILAAWHMDQKSGLIESGGLILCKMPQEMVDQRNAEYRRRTTQNMSSAEEHYMRDDHELIKKFKENRSRKVYGFSAR